MGVQTTQPQSPEVMTADAVIVGGGMVGMTLAAALGHAGIAVALVDAQPVSARTAGAYDGRSSAIAFGSQRVLAGIGAWGAMAAEAQPILDIRVSDGDARGRVSGLFLHYDHRDLDDHGNVAGPSGDGGAAEAPPFGYIVENRVTRRALLDRLAALSTVTHLAPARLAGLTREAGGVRVALEPNPAGARAIAARLVIAADGQNSTVRGAAGIRVTDWTYPQTGIVCTVAHEKPHHGVAHEHFLPSGPFAMLPMTTDREGRHRSSIVWTERAAFAPVMMALAEEDFAAEIQHRFGDSLGRLTPIGGRWAYPLRLLHAERYVDRRLALIGDAAHTIHPIAGQGLNLGLRDVAALAEVLVDAHRLGLDIGAADVLAGYERRRRFDNLVLMAVTDGLNRLFSNDIPPLRLARDLGLAAVDRMPPLKRVLMRHAMGTVGPALPRLIRGERL